MFAITRQRVRRRWRQNSSVADAWRTTAVDFLAICSTLRRYDLQRHATLYWTSALSNASQTITFTCTMTHLHCSQEVIHNPRMQCKDFDDARRCSRVEWCNKYLPAFAADRTLNTLCKLSILSYGDSTEYNVHTMLYKKLTVGSLLFKQWADTFFLIHTVQQFNYTVMCACYTRALCRNHAIKWRKSHNYSFLAQKMTKFEQSWPQWRRYILFGPGLSNWRPAGRIASGPRGELIRPAKQS